MIEWDDGDVAGNRERHVPVLAVAISLAPPRYGATISDLDGMASLDVDGDDGLGGHVLGHA
jgi:hypothetical protein